MSNGDKAQPHPLDVLALLVFLANRMLLFAGLEHELLTLSKPLVESDLNRGSAWNGCSFGGSGIFIRIHFV